MKLFLRAAPRVLPALALFSAACSDHTPLSDTTVDGPRPRLQRLECTARVRAGTLACASPAPEGGARGDLMVGSGRVKLTSANVRFDSAAGVLHADVTVQNLMQQAIGTVNGATADSTGVKVFFSSGPTVTQGSGGATVANADGLGTFTATTQPFFRYTGVLQPLQTSAPRDWQFALDAGVEQFTFALYVSVPMANEAGRVDVNPPLPYVHAGATRQLTATVRTAAGGVVAGAPVAWATSDGSVATVNASGLVTAVSAGGVLITATSGGRTGYAHLVITAGTGDVTPATLTALSFTPHLVDVNSGPARVTVTLTAEDAESGLQSAGIVFRSPSAMQEVNCFATTFTGTAASATFQCTLTIPQGAEAGTWKPGFVVLYDRVNNLSDVEAPYLEETGFWTALRVEGSPDVTAPAVTSLAFSPDSVDITGARQQVGVTIGGTDAQTGMSSVSIMLRSPSGTHDTSCGTTQLASGTARSGTFQCTAPLPRGSETGDWQVAFIAIRDLANNLRSVQGADLAAAGLPTTVRVRGTADTVPPVVTAFSFSPGAVDARTQARQVTLTLGAADAGTGVDVESSNIVFRSPSTSQGAACQPTTRVSGSDADGTWQCQVSIPAGAEGGAWTVGFIALRDHTNNLRVANGSDLAAAGFPITLSVTSN